MTLLTCEQAKKAVVLSQYLSAMFQGIHLFRYDSVNEQIFIIAGVDEDIEIIIFSSGEWEFNEQL